MIALAMPAIDLFVLWGLGITGLWLVLDALLDRGDL